MATDGPRVVASGWGDHGRLGLIDESYRLGFTCIDDLADLGIIPHELACGDRHSLVLTTAGVAYAFGDGEQGQLGVGSDVVTNADPSLRRRTRPVPVDVSELGFVAHIAAADTASVAINGKGQVWAWGDNRRGELGQGDTEPRPVPTMVRGIADRRIKQVACGGHHVLALTGSGQVFSWGMGTRGQLGHKGCVEAAAAAGAAGAAAAADKPTPVMVETLRGARVIHVGAGREYSMAVATTKALHILGEENHVGRKTKEQRVVVGWGDNRSGQLGNGAKDAGCEIPTLNDFLLMEQKESLGTHTVARVFCGAFHTIFLLENSTLFVCGLNQYGQLGTGDTWDVLIPRHILSVGNVISVGCGNRHTVLATGGKGVVYAAGFDHWGELGQGLGKVSMMFKPVRPLKGTKGVAVAAGARHTLCIISDDVDTVAAQFMPVEVPGGDIGKEEGAREPPGLVLTPGDPLEMARIAAAAAAAEEKKAAAAEGKDGGDDEPFVPSDDDVDEDEGGEGDAEEGKEGKDGGGGAAEQIPNRMVRRQAASDGFSLTVLGQPAVRSGKYRWDVQMDRLVTDYHTVVGVAYLDGVEALYDPENQGNGNTWLYLSNGDSLYVYLWGMLRSV